MKDLVKSAKRVVQAVDGPGINPQYHVYKVGEMKETWPTLYWAIEDLRNTLREQGVIK